MAHNPIQQVSSRYLRRIAAGDPMRTLQEIYAHMQAVDGWARELNQHTETMRALIAAGEARRLGRTSQIQVRGLTWDGKRISATVVGSQGNEYHTHITIHPKRGHHCTCPDWEKRGRQVGPCKHVLKLGRVWLEDSVVPAIEGLDQRLESILSHASL